MQSKAAANGWAVPYSCAYKLGGTTVKQGRPLNPWFQHREIKPLETKSLEVKTYGVAAVGETPNLTGEVIGETTGP